MPEEQDTEYYVECCVENHIENNPAGWADLSGSCIEDSRVNNRMNAAEDNVGVADHT